MEATKKGARNGNLKWRLNHLPPGTDTAFTNDLVPLAKAKAGEQVHAWSELGIQQIQKLLDDVYGPGCHTVVANDVWCGLVSNDIQPFHILIYFCRFHIGSATGAIPLGQLPHQQLRHILNQIQMTCS